MKTIRNWFRHLGYVHHESDLTPALYHVANPLLGEVAVHRCKFCGRRIGVVLGWD